jgi:flavin-dependent dehydrogenase
MMCDFDVIIVGGGPAGSSAAIHLARAGGRVLLAEQERFPRAKLCGEFISPECLAHFARLGVLGAMEGAGGAKVHETVFYTRGGRAVAVPSEWFAGATARAALGLSRAVMDSRLLEGARAAGVEVLEEATASGLLLEGARVRGVRLGVAGGEVREHTARVVVDATGRQRALARRVARAERNEGEGRRSPLVAFKAHLEGARGAEGVCEIYFYPGGYGGLSAVEGGAHNLCFIARAADVRARASDAARLMREVVMRNRRAAVTLDGARARDRWLGVALQSFGRHDPVPAEGLITVGDAASFIDPFTGSGMLMALESGELAARVVSDWLPDARRDRRNFDALARAYAAHYAARFDSRLRLCGLLRRAAFAPPALTEAAAVALNASARLRHKLARATRRAGARAPV